MAEPCGILIINKHTGVTSHDIVNRARRLYNTKKVGHTGTLDPLASGVLVVLIGRAAKAAEYLSSDKKGYKARIRLGITSDTEDITGNILTRSDNIPSESEVQLACEKFIGDIQQIPPMYSALKVNGKKLCDLARKGIEVERKARGITVYSLAVTPTDSVTDYVLDVTCSAGTYIRTLCADIGKELGCGAVMAELERTEAGGFSIENAVSVKELEEMTESERLSLLLPTERLFASLPEVRLSEFYERLCKSGCEIYQKKIGTRHEAGKRVRISTASGAFFALGEIREYENGSAVKAIKQFDI